MPLSYHEEALKAQAVASYTFAITRKAENKNKRYISMNGIHPTDETVQFVEYNNTGAGAITEAVAGMRMLTAKEAANYAGNGQDLTYWNTHLGGGQLYEE